jgi:uncharacterized protein YdeI (BOF family)
MSKGARLAIVAAIIIAITAGAMIAATSMPGNSQQPPANNNGATNGTGKQITIDLNESFTMDAK